MRVLLTVFLWFIPITLFASEEEALAALEKAVIDAAVFENARFAFTLEHWERENDEETSLVVRYDPRNTDGEVWTLSSGAREDDLSKAEKKTLKSLRKSEADDAMLIYDGLDDLLPAATLKEETDNYYIFVSKITDDETPEKIRDALDVFLTLEKEGGHISVVEVQSKHEFKPAPIAKITRMQQRSEFSPPTEELPPVLLVNSSAAEGKAMLRRFNSQSRQTISDIEMLPADGNYAPRSSADK